MSPVRETIQKKPRQRTRDVCTKKVYLVTAMQDELYIGTLNSRGVSHNMQPLKHIQASKIPLGSKFILRRSQMTKAQAMEAISFLGLSKI